MDVRTNNLVSKRAARHRYLEDMELVTFSIEGHVAQAHRCFGVFVSSVGKLPFRLVMGASPPLLCFWQQ